MPDLFSYDPMQESREALNQEITELYEEVEALHAETGMLVGLMAGSFAFFLKRLMMAHQSQTPLLPQDCEQIAVDALSRVLSTQNRFDYSLVREIETLMERMGQSELFQTFLQQAIAQSNSQH